MIQRYRPGQSAHEAGAGSRLHQQELVPTEPMPGYKRLQESGQAEILRQKVLEEQAAALSEAGKRRPTSGPADQARDAPTWPANHFPEPKKKGKRK